MQRYLPKIQSLEKKLKSLLPIGQKMLIFPIYRLQIRIPYKTPLIHTHWRFIFLKALSVVVSFNYIAIWCGGKLWFCRLPSQSGLFAGKISASFSFILNNLTVRCKFKLKRQVLTPTFKSFSGEEKNGSWNDSLSNVVTDLEVWREEILSVNIHLLFLILRQGGWVEKVEETVVLNLGKRGITNVL